MNAHKLTALFLAVSAWLVSLCLFMPPSHACCPPGRHEAQKQLPACCVVNPVTVTQPDQTGFTGPLPNMGWVSSSGLGFDYQALLAEQPALMQSRTDLAFRPDQSKRYLELGVLLT
ncbi:hypothetical protein [Vampirovibrio sp.]|uniref:hypothetical protein n=1 Tax=Vampirovibrio sp. TaxID=2717857 RepID=UPI003593091B